MFERIMIGIYGGLLPAFSAICVASLLFGKDFVLIGKKFDQGAWALIFCWIGTSILFAVIKRPVAAWRAALLSSAGVLIVGGVAGTYSNAPHNIEFLLSLFLIAALLLATAYLIGEDKVKRPKMTATTSPTSGSIIKARAIQIDSERWLRVALYLWTAIVFIESFRLAHVIATDPHRGVGMFGMLVSILLLLPAASIVTWWPRVASLLFSISAAIFVWAYTRSGLPQLIVAIVINIVMALLISFMIKADNKVVILNDVKA